MKTPISMSMHEFRSALLLVVVTAILSLSPCTLHAQLPSYVPTNGLIGYWPFDGDASDKSGNSNSGTASDVSFGNDRFGKTNSAGVFDSVSRVAVRLPQTPVGDQAKTIACWVYSESYESPDRFIAGFPIRSATQAFGLAALRCCPRDLCLWGMDYDYFAGGSLTNGRWHFIAAAYESGVLRLVIDDSVVVRTSSGFNTADVEFVIGCFEPANRVLHSMIGKIDDVGLWDRALTNDELRTLFNGQACNVTITSQPQSVIVPPSTQAQLSITTSSDSLTTYTWQISNGSGFVDLTEGNDYAGVSTSQLTIASASSSTAGKYRCVASTSQCSVTSQIANVRLQNANLPSYIPAAGLAGWWPFNGNANDESGIGNDGIVNGATLAIDRDGISNSAFAFNGSNSTIDCPYPSIPQKGSFTISLWVNPSSVSGVQEFLHQNWWPAAFYVGVNGGVMRCGDYWQNTGVSIASSKWQHIVIVRNYLSNVEIYLNGALKASLGADITLGGDTTNPLVFGKQYPGNSEYYNGVLDDIGIWDRTLTEAEIQALYLSTACNVTITAQPQSTEARLSERVLLSVSATSDTAVTYQWQFNAGSQFVDLVDGGKYTGVLTAQLTIDSMSAATEGEYRCIVSTSKCSVASQVASVTIRSESLPSYVPTDGLVGWWPFNSNAKDESGNRNDGIVQGPTLVPDRFGNANKAYKFDGIDDFIQMPNQALTNSVSFSGWYKLSSFNTPGNDIFFVSNQSPSGTVYSANIAFGFRSYSGEYGHSTYVASPLTGYYATNNLPTVDVWHHIVCVFEDGAYVKMYLDNTLVYERASVITNPMQDSLPLLFGGTGTSSAYYHYGELDDIGVWDRALTEAEIQALYLGVACSVSITSQPQNTQVDLTAKAVLNVSANADTAMTYQWQFNAGSQFVDLVDGGKYSGVLTAQLTIDSMSAATEGEYRCIVSTSKCSVTSQPALVRVSVNLPSYIPTNGLLGWWPFDSNADDESGNRNDGVVTGATPTFDRTGTPNSAYSFDGLQNKIAVNMTPPSGAEPRTISSWFKTTADLIPTSQYPELQTIVAWGNGAGGAIIFDQYVHCRIAGDTMAVRGRAYFESGSSDNQLISSGVVNDGQWHHMVTTYAGPGTRVKLYVDGKLQDSTVSLTLITAVSEVGIGYCPWANIPFRGEIDDVGIWNRALTETEIQSLYLGKPCNLSITSHPASSVVRSSERVVLSVTAVSDSMVAYSWQMMNGGVFVDLTDGSDYTGVTTPQLSIASMSTSTVGAYRCVVSTSQCSLTSQIANVSINTVSLPDYVPAAGLVGWWPFNGNAKDESGNQNHADSVNGATLALNRFGEANSSYLFDGIDDYLFVPKPFFDNGWKDWTVSLWYKLDPSSNFGLFLNTDPHWGMALGVGTGAEYRLGIGNAAGSWNVLDPGVQHSNTDFVYDQWAHVTVVKNGLQVSLYVNGVRDSTVVGASLPPAYLCKMYFGRAHQYGEYYKGLLDDIGLWSRALSASEIESLYNGTAQPRGQIDVGSFNYGTLPSDELINSSGGHVGSVTVRNRTGVDLELVGADVSDSTVFVVPNQWPRRMYNGDSTEIAIRFLPREKRLYQADFTVRASNSFTGISTVAGAGRDLNADERVTQVLLRPSQEFVAPGDTLSVALRVGIERPLTTAGTAGKYFAMIQWDSRVLEPLPTPGLKFDTAGTYGVGELQNSSRQQNQMQLYTFRFRAKQAEVDTTTIIFTGSQGFAWQDDRKAYPALVDSVVRVRICRDGGPQLVGRMVPAQIVRATPSPARDAVDIELNLSSAGTIDIMSADGRRVMTREVNHETKNLRLDLTGLSAGIYTVVLTTPTASDHVTMIVVP